MLSVSSIPRVNVMGIGINDVTMGSALQEVEEAAGASGCLGYVTVTGVHGVIESQSDPDLTRIHNRSYLSIPDGIPMVWMGWLQGRYEMAQVCGPEFMPALIERGLSSRRRHFLWGGGNGVVETLKKVLVTRHPDVEIVGTVTPPFRPLTSEEELDLVEEINRTQPHYFWVGLSTPKQERFMAGFLERHASALRRNDHGLILLGVGAAFDFQAGIVQEAPKWLRGSGLEWFFRLLKDPKRLAGRYLRNNPRFLWGVLQQFAGVKYSKISE